MDYDKLTSWSMSSRFILSAVSTEATITNILEKFSALSKTWFNFEDFIKLMVIETILILLLLFLFTTKRSDTKVMGSLS